MDRDAVIGLAGLVGIVFGVSAVLFGCYFGGYKYGRHLERKELTAALIHNLEDAYYDGFGDGFRACKKEMHNDL